MYSQTTPITSHMNVYRTVKIVGNPYIGRHCLKKHDGITFYSQNDATSVKSNVPSLYF